MSRRVLVLAILVLAVGGWLVLRELPILQSEGDRAAAELQIFRVVPDVVDTVRFSHPAREILLVRNDESGWWLQSPITEKVPDLNIEDLVVRLANTERWRRVARAVSGDEWELYGLGPDSPGRVRVELSGGGQASVLDVGLLTPGSRSVWVRRAGSNELELCLEDLYNLANMSYQGLRDPRLFPIKHSRLRSLRFISGDHEWTSVRDEDGLWYLGSLDGPRLKRWVVEEFGFAVAGQRVDGYLRDDLVDADWAAYGLDQPWATIEWEATEGRRGILWLGNELDNVMSFGRRSGLETVFRIAPGLAPALEADTVALVDHNPIGGNFLHATQIRVSSGEGYVDVFRETPAVSIATESGPLEPGEYSQVAGRNLQYGLEEFQPIAEMIVPVGREPAELLDTIEARMSIHWPEREVRLQIGQLAGQAWIAIDGEATLWQVGPGMLLRVREVLALREPD